MNTIHIPHCQDIKFSLSVQPKSGNWTLINTDKTGSYRKCRYHSKGEYTFLLKPLKYQYKSAQIIASKCFF